jgi:hypothetical protein
MIVIKTYSKGKIFEIHVAEENYVNDLRLFKLGKDVA